MPPRVIAISLPPDRSDQAATIRVALATVDAMAKGRPVVYTPARWRLIMLVVRHLPRFIFNRLQI